MQIQYLGFRPKAHGRDYSYQVVEVNSKPREFVFSISTRALVEGRIRYQDAASVCYQKLQRALEEETEQRPVPSHATLSDRDFDEYRDARTPTKRHASYSPQHRRALN